MSRPTRPLTPLVVAFLVSWASYLPAAALEPGPELRVTNSPFLGSSAVAPGADGSFVITWVEASGAGGIVGRRYEARGVSIGGTFQVSDTGVYPRSYPQAASSAAGDLVVTWAEPDSSIRARRFDRAGQPRGGSFRVAEESYIGGTVGMNAGGDFVVVWSDAYNGSGVRRYDRNGNALGPGFLVQAPSSLDGGNRGDVAVRDDGGFILTWSARFGQLFFQIYDPNGDPVGAPVSANHRGLTNAIGLADDASFVIAWRHFDSNAGADREILFQRYSADGAPLGSTVEVEHEGIAVGGSATVAVDGDGSFFVVWACCVGDQVDVFAQQFSPSGVRVGDPFVVNDHRDGDQSDPAAAVLDDGSLVVAWSNSASPGAPVDRIVARRFDRGLRNDRDGDGVLDGADNCPTVANPDQTDAQADGHGDACVSPDVFLPSDLRLGANPVIGTGTRLAARTTIGDHARVGEQVTFLAGLRAGSRVRIDDFAIIGRRVTLGDRVTIGMASGVEAAAVLGDDVWIDDRVEIRRNAVMERAVTIQSLAVIQAGARIGSGATIEEGVLVGRQAVVLPGARVPAGTRVPPGTTFPTP